MAVVVTADCRPYYNYGLHELTEGTVIPDGEFARYLLATGAPVAEQTDTTGDVDGDGVPDGTAKAVLDWVGDDPARAALALQAENGRGKPRSSLVAALEKLAGPAGEQPPAPDGGATGPDAPAGPDEGGTDADGQG